MVKGSLPCLCTCQGNLTFSPDTLLAGRAAASPASVMIQNRINGPGEGRLQSLQGLGLKASLGCKTLRIGFPFVHFKVTRKRPKRSLVTATVTGAI